MSAQTLNRYEVDKVIEVLKDKKKFKECEQEMADLAESILMAIQKNPPIPSTDDEPESYGVFAILDNTVHTPGQNPSINFDTLCDQLMVAIDGDNTDQAIKLLLRVIARLMFVGFGVLQERPMVPFIAATELLSGRRLLDKDYCGPVSARIARLFAIDQDREQANKCQVTPSTAVVVLYRHKSQTVCGVVADTLINIITHARFNVTTPRYNYKSILEEQRLLGKDTVISFVLANLITHSESVRPVRWDTFSNLFSTAAMITSMVDRGARQGKVRWAYVQSKRILFSDWVQCLHSYDKIAAGGTELMTLLPTKVVADIISHNCLNVVTPKSVFCTNLCNGTYGQIFLNLACFARHSLGNIRDRSNDSIAYVTNKFYRKMGRLLSGRQSVQLPLLPPCPDLSQEVTAIFVNDALAKFDYQTLAYLDNYQEDTFTADNMAGPCESCAKERAPITVVIELAEKFFEDNYSQLSPGDIMRTVHSEAFYGQTPGTDQTFDFLGTKNAKNMALITERAIQFLDPQHRQSAVKELALMMAITNLIANFDEELPLERSKSDQPKGDVYVNYINMKWTDDCAIFQSADDQPQLPRSLMPITREIAAKMGNAAGYSGKGKLTRVSDHGSEAVALSCGSKTRFIHPKVYRQTHWLVRGNPESREMATVIVALSRSASAAQLFEYALELFSLSSLSGELQSKQRSSALNLFNTNCEVQSLVASRKVLYFICCHLTKSLLINWQRVKEQSNSIRDYAPGAKNFCLHQMTRLPTASAAETSVGLAKLPMNEIKFNCRATSEEVDQFIDDNGFSFSSDQLLVTAANLEAVDKVSFTRQSLDHLVKEMIKVKSSSPYALFTACLKECAVAARHTTAFFVTINQQSRPLTKFSYTVRSFYLSVKADVDAARQSPRTGFLAQLVTAAHQLLAVFDHALAKAVADSANGIISLQEAKCSYCHTSTSREVNSAESADENSDDHPASMDTD